MVNGSLIAYGLQTKPYAWEALWSTLAVIGWLRARENDGRRFKTITGYALMGAGPIAALPVILLVGPLAAFEAGRSLRRRRWQSLPGPVLVGAVALLHFWLFIVPQSALLGDPVWAKLYLSPLHAPSQVLHGLASFVPEIGTAALLQPDDVPGSFLRTHPLMPHVHGPAAACLAGGIIVLGAGGVASALRRRRTKSAVVALAGALGLMVVAALLRRWPFGYTRVSLFLLPEVYAVLALGGHAAVRLARRSRRRLVSVIVAIGLVGFVADAGLLGSHWVSLSRSSASAPLLMDAMPEIVQRQRQTAQAGDVAVVLIQPDRYPWDRAYLYAALFQPQVNKGGYRIPAHDIFISKGYDRLALRRFLHQHPNARRLFYLQLFYVNSTAAKHEKADLSASWHLHEKSQYPATGLYVQFEHNASP